MRIFLAGTASQEQIVKENCPKYILESFYYIKDWQKKLIHETDDFLLDSGAFTFIQKANGQINWYNYIENYAEYIKQNKVKNFFELDIDSVVGYQKVIEFRSLLERLTGERCIPVWHKNRGVDEYKRHCQEYPYVGIGGYVIKELNNRDYAAFPSMIKYAHERKTKVHCLGFTATCKFSKYHFDSVDSTTWIIGAKFGNICILKNNIIQQVHYSNKRCSNVAELMRYNLSVWVKFQKYAETHL